MVFLSQYSNFFFQCFFERLRCCGNCRLSALGLGAQILSKSLGSEVPDLEAAHVAMAFDLSMELAIDRYYR